MELVSLQDTRLLDWLNARLGTTFEADQCRWVAGLGLGGVIFVVAYSRFSARNCELTIATDGSKRWATRRSLRAIFTPPFRQWNLRRVTFVAAGNNRESIDMLERLGAKHEGCVRCAFPKDVHGHVYGMLAEECRWL